jgi:hypothetical protein
MTHAPLPAATLRPPAEEGACCTHRSTRGGALRELHGRFEELALASSPKHRSTSCFWSSWSRPSGQGLEKNERSSASTTFPLRSYLELAAGGES